MLIATALKLFPRGPATRGRTSNDSELWIEYRHLGWHLSYTEVGNFDTDIRGNSMHEAGFGESRALADIPTQIRQLWISRITLIHLTSRFSW
jgi:hypothetical protein